MSGAGERPGWYPDPSGSGQRYWSGEAWLDAPEGPQRPPQTAKGWYRDPMNSGGWRWWDGERWTENLVGAGGASAEASEQGSGGAVSGVVKVALGVVLGIVVVVAGCAVLVGVGAHKAEEQQNAHAITQAQFDAITLGSSQASVEQQLGQPESAQQFQAAGGGLDNYDSACDYYPESDVPLLQGNYFQFCFTGGVLDSKNAY